MDKKGRMLLVSTLGVAILATAPSKVKAEDLQVADADKLMTQTAVVSSANVGDERCNENEMSNQIETNDDLQNQSIQEDDLKRDNVQNQFNEGESISIDNSEVEDVQQIGKKTESVQNDDSANDESGQATESLQELANTSSNGWVTDEKGNTKYHVAGNYVVGLVTIDSKQYYFDYDGNLQTSGIHTIDGINYISQNDGETVRAGNNTWTKVDGKYYYFKDNRALQNCVEKIGNSYYGFDSFGVMYDDTIFDLNDRVYVAKKGGYLRRNEWYKYSEDDKRYIGDDCAFANGIVAVAGKTYYFSSGKYSRSTCVNIGGKLYVCGDDGTAVEAKNNAWTYVDESYYYSKDGELLKNCVVEIGKYYYGFDMYGRMYSDVIFRDNDKWYGAKKNGALYVNEWYTYEGPYHKYEKYYFGNTGVAASGLTVISGEKYYFDDYGVLMTNGIKFVDGRNYVSKSDGSLVEAENNKWTKVDGLYYYVRDNVVLQNCVEKIGNAYYGFDDSGIMYSDREFFIRGNNEDYPFSHCYRAKKSGALYVNEWYNGYYKGDKYYYGKEGVKAFGLTVIGEKLYYFDDGKLVIDNSIDVGGVSYIAGHDGCLQTKTNGWLLVDGSYYYFQKKLTLKQTVSKIGKYYYGFDDKGRMYDNGLFRIFHSTGDKYNDGYYYAKKDGSLLVNELCKSDNRYGIGITYYFGADAKGISGIQAIDGKKYLFTNGVLAKNGTYCDGRADYISEGDGTAIKAKKGWNKVEGNYYYLTDDFGFYQNQIVMIGNSLFGFDSKGRMYDNECFNSDGVYGAKKGGYLYVNSWAEFNGSMYYFGEQGEACCDLQTIEGKKYYFDNEGRLKTNYAFSKGNDNYISDSNGIVHNVEGSDKWFKIDGKYYYVKEASFIKGCVEKIGNAMYGFSYDGFMYADTEFYPYYNANADHYRAKTNGALYVNEWSYNRDGSATYYGADAKAVKGIITINGHKRYFWNGVMARNEAFTVDGVNYVADRDGNLLKLKAEGWTLVGEYYYYTKNNYYLRSRVAQIGSSYYGFDSWGRMYADTTFDMSFFDKGVYYDHITFLADKNGSLKTNTWIESWYSKYFLDEKGSGFKGGLQTINNVKYYFTEMGWLLNEGGISVDGVNYGVRSDGSVIELGNNKWTQVDGKWYYVKNGYVLKGCKAKIGNVTYLFKANGALANNETVWDYEIKRCYRADKDGKVCSNLWIKIEDSYMYFGNNGMLSNGKYTVDGKQYYFDNDGYLKYGVINIDGVLYVTDNGGALSKLNKTGWILTRNNYYYVSGKEKYINGVYKIGGKYYGFDENGRMYNDELCYINDKRYFASKGGALVLNKAVTVKGSKYYFDISGKGYEGYHTIGGKEYFFIDGKLMTNYAFCLNGNYYVLDSKGQKKTIKNNTWTKIDNKYYYVKDGSICCDGVYKINGSYYAFSKDGNMLDNEFGYFGVDQYPGIERYLGTNIVVHAGVNGTLTTGWYQDPQSKSWYYFAKNGFGYDRVHYIGGKKYNFSNGKMI